MARHSVGAVSEVEAAGKDCPAYCGYRFVAVFLFLYFCPLEDLDLEEEVEEECR